MRQVFMFPGQSSRDPAMVERAFAMATGVAADVFDEASDVLGRDLRAHFLGDPGDLFATNRDIQLGVFLTSHVHLKALQAEGIDAELSLGLSLGEYNHLVHIGALDFADAVRLVDIRGGLYAEGPEGAMAAIFPIDPDDLAPLLEEARMLGSVDVAVHGSPTQTVVAGTRAAVQHVAARADDEHLCESVLIEDRVPMHVPLFAPVAERFGPALAAAPWRRAERPYLPNVEGRHVAQNGPSTYVEPLRRHVFERVRWRESIDFLFAEHDDLSFVEVGPRQALTNLLSPRWHRAPRHHTDHPEGPEGGFHALVEELADGPG
ncbi:MAG: ACP S-malonyltransferase [Sandaracinaceae bacterium]